MKHSELCSILSILDNTSWTQKKLLFLILTFFFFYLYLILYCIPLLVSFLSRVADPVHYRAWSGYFGRNPYPVFKYGRIWIRFLKYDPKRFRIRIRVFFSKVGSRSGFFFKVGSGVEFNRIRNPALVQRTKLSWFSLVASAHNFAKPVHMTYQK